MRCVGNSIRRQIQGNAAFFTPRKLTNPGISKFQILEECFNKFDLKFKLVEKIESISPTGVKKNYYSLSRKAEKINYSPQFSSLETILNESSLFLENSHISFGQNKPKKL